MNFAIKNSRKIWVQVIFGKITINSQMLESGDAVAIENEDEIKIIAQENAR